MGETSKREQLLREAVRIVMDKGFDALDAGTLAKRLKMARSGVFYYFHGQADLVDAVQQYVLRQAEAEVERITSHTVHGRAEDKLTAYLLGTLQFAYKQREYVTILTLTFLRCRSQEDREKIHQQTTGRGLQKIYNFLTMGIAEREFSLDGPIRDTALLIHHLLVGACLHLYYTTLDPKEFSRYSKAFLEFVGRQLKPVGH